MPARRCEIHRAELPRRAPRRGRARESPPADAPRRVAPRGDGPPSTPWLCALQGTVIGFDKTFILQAIAFIVVIPLLLFLRVKRAEAKAHVELPME